MNEFDIKRMDYSIDYISGVVPTPFVTRFFKDLAMVDPVKLGFSCFQKWKTGLNFYKERWCLNDQSYFTLAYNEPGLNEDLPLDYDPSTDFLICSMQEGKNRGIYLSISGDGLRYLGDKTVGSLIKLLGGYGFKCTRIDFACDVYDPDNQYVPLLNQALSNVYCQRGFVPGEYSVTTNLSRATGNIKRFTNFDPFRDPELLKKIGQEIAPGCYETYNFTWGRKDSTKCQFRMYDKWLEVKTVKRLQAVADQIIADTPASVSNYWYRFEYEMHQLYANDLFYNLFNENTSVPGAFAWCAEDCFFPVLCGFGLNRDLCDQQSSDIWEDFIDLARQLGAHEVVQTIHFVQSKFYAVEDRINYVKNNLPLYYMGFCLFKAYPWLLDRVLEDGRRSFFDNRKNIPFLNHMNKNFFDNDIFVRRDIPTVPDTAFEQLNIDSLFDNFPEFKEIS